MRKYGRYTRRKFLRDSALFSAGLAGVSLAGCETTTTAPTATTTVPTTLGPVSGGTIKYMTQSWPDDVDVRTGPVNACAQAVWNSVCDAWINFEPDFSTTGILVEDWGHSSDYMTWSFTFREGVNFHNGDEMTTHDFEGWAKAYTAHTDYQGPKPFFQGPFKGRIDSWDILDSYSVDINMKTPQWEFDRDLANYPCTYMIPYDDWMNTEQNTSVCSTGAYKFVEHVSRSYITLTKNDDWWATREGMTSDDSFWYGAQYLDDITVKYGAEESTKLVALETGDVHVAQLVDQAAANQADANPELGCIFAPQSRMISCLCNVRNPPMNDVRVREMLLKAIDWAAVNAIAAAGLPESNSIFYNSPYENENIDNYIPKYDPDRAQELYEELDGEGLFTRDINITASLGDIGDSAPELMKSSISSLCPNVNIYLNPVDTSTNQAWRVGNVVYDAATPHNHWDLHANSGLAGASESMFTPVKFGYTKRSIYVKVGENSTYGCPECTSGNYMGWTNARAEDLYDQALADPTLEGRKAAVNELEEIVFSEYACRPYCLSGAWFAYNNAVHDFTVSPAFKRGIFNWLDVWLEQ